MDHELLLITLGVLFLAGLVADQIGRLTRLPRVTMLLLLGILAGPSGLNLLPDDASGWFELVSVVALTMVAFLLGGELTRENLMRHGKPILTISLAITVATLLVVWAGLSAIGLDPGLALLLGAIATATDPAAIADGIRQAGARSGFTETITGIVAIDDVWGIVAFSACLALVGQGGGLESVLGGAGAELGGAVLLSLAIGVPGAFLTGRLKPGEPLQAEAIGIVLLTAGLALWLEVSFLVAGILTGALIANLARHHDYAFNEIEHIEWPFMLLFFLLAGASLDIGELAMIGWISFAYIVLRILSRLIGGEVGAALGGVSGPQRHAYGPALLPQAGVAVGMALVAAEEFPQWASVVMALTIASTVVFELIGPLFTAAALHWLETRNR
ncbi:cation:proton antiporter [Defluviimonas sp. WL0002]|uniref:Cation:proton antiporter n=1 Tax=Albidovulum marisflavi TaxID=2984159 RepID=A0ABT2ZD60_9RHOB|nr:cation:proton antiporter [Defluviimonas sp. WL0002]MCV2868681.1 cation:proton antiporter [Defluviimonas sp. WL0002]